MANTPVLAFVKLPQLALAGFAAEQLRMAQVTPWPVSLLMTGVRV
jgi:hypothetical protein